MFNWLRHFRPTYEVKVYGSCPNCCSNPNYVDIPVGTCADEHPVECHHCYQRYTLRHGIDGHGLFVGSLITEDK